MSDDIPVNELKNYFQDKLDRFGLTPRGVDWNSTSAQEIRFDQLTRIISPGRPYSLLDYGSGFGALYDYLRRRGDDLTYLGFDFVPDMVSQGAAQHTGQTNCCFTSDENNLPPHDYVIASGIFNIRLQADDETWTRYVLSVLHIFHTLSRYGFSFNMLTKYSDREYMKSHLYYGDPGFYFDYCKRNFSLNVALLHDYDLYDFTILVRKEGSSRVTNQG
jgi:SAM-dependent methyltransferase